MRGRCTLQKVEPVEGGVQATWQVLVEREGTTKPCCAAEWLVRYYLLSHGTLRPQQVLNGLVTGSVYSLVALGLTLIYGTMQVPNFAHGQLLHAGARTCPTSLMTRAGLHYWAAMAIAMWRWRSPARRSSVWCSGRSRMMRRISTR